MNLEEIRWGLGSHGVYSMVPYMQLNGVSSKYLILRPKCEVNIYLQVLALFEKLSL